MKLYRLFLSRKKVFSQSDGQVLLQVGYFITSSPTCSNTNVCVQRSCLCDESRSLDGRSRATFTIKPVVCCVVLRSKVVNDTTGESVRAERIVKRL